MIRARYWIGALLVVAALGYLAVTGANRNTVTYVSIRDVLANPAMARTSGVRVTGVVVEGSIESRGPRDVWFRVAGDDESLLINYRGVVPDTFKDGADVVLEGQMDLGGHFAATTLLAKCPSKYEAEVAHPEEVARGTGQKDY